MYDSEPLNDSTTFSTIKDNNYLFTKSKPDSDQDSDSTIIIDADSDKSSTQMKSVSKYASPTTSVNNNSVKTSYSSTSKAVYSDINFMDKPTCSYSKDNNYYFSNDVDPNLESILLKYSSPPPNSTETIQSCSVGVRKISPNNEKFELIELSSDEDEHRLKTQINYANKSISSVIKDKVDNCGADAILRDLSQKYKRTLTEEAESPTKFQAKDNRLGSVTFESNMLNLDNTKLSNEYTPILEEDDDFPWTNIQNHKETSLITNIAEVDQKHILDKYKTIFNNNGVNTETNCLNNLQKGDSPDLYKSPKKKRKLTSDENNKKASKAELQAKKREEAEIEKKLKQALLTANKNMKPEVCMKFMTVLLDSEITNENYVGDVFNSLQAASIAYRLQPQLIPHTITWNRKVEIHSVDTEQEATTNGTETGEVLLILKSKEMAELVHNRSLVNHVKSLQSILTNKKLSLAIYGMENYFKYQKSQKQKDMRSEITGTLQRSNNKYDKIYKDAAKINMKQLEFALTELQLLCCCCHRMIETADDLGAMIVQFTKSIAQAPYKLEKQRKEQEAQWFISGDNKDCVHVDKNGNGLQRLWQQQLTTFPLARLEHAEAIVSKYATPTSLMEAYNFCTHAEGEKLLQEIPIRRAAGPLTTVRKIGPELSKKIFKFFTSTDGNVIL